MDEEPARVTGDLTFWTSCMLTTAPHAIRRLASHASNVALQLRRPAIPFRAWRIDSEQDK